jgi:hypothetical protein
MTPTKLIVYAAAALLVVFVIWFLFYSTGMEPVAPS